MLALIFLAILTALPPLFLARARWQWRLFWYLLGAVGLIAILWPDRPDCRDDCAGNLCHVDCSEQSIIRGILWVLGTGGVVGVLLRTTFEAIRIWSTSRGSGR